MQYKGGKSSAADMAIRRNRILETGFRYFARHGIVNSSMKEIAKEAGVGIATLFRYYPSKTNYVLEIATWKWHQLFQSILQQLQEVDVSSMTSAQRYEFFLDSFVVMYQNNRDLLRFNQFFNIYLQNEQHDPALIRPYLEMIDSISDTFTTNLTRLMSDGTMRQVTSIQEIFTVSVHLMLAVATRFAVGLIYQPDIGMSPEEELLLLKEMLLKTYTLPEQER